MCLSKAVRLEGDKQVEICAYVSRFRTEGETVILTDVLGEETTLTGRISRVDLVKNLIVIEAA